MKLNIFLIIIGLLYLTGCSSEPKDGSSQSQAKEELKSVTKPFSDIEKLDTFKVVLSGDKPKNMRLKFSIISYKGQEIYTQHFEAKTLIDQYKQTVDLKNEDKQVAFMKKEFDMFFDDENFLEPAVTETEHADQFVPDKAFFAELKQSGLNGFMYQMGQENKVYIAWSRAQNKVKIYYKCC